MRKEMKMVVLGIVFMINVVFGQAMNGSETTSTTTTTTTSSTNAATNLNDIDWTTFDFSNLNLDSFVTPVANATNTSISITPSPIISNLTNGNYSYTTTTTTYSTNGNSTGLNQFNGLNLLNGINSQSNDIAVNNLTTNDLTGLNNFNYQFSTATTTSNPSIYDASSSLNLTLPQSESNFAIQNITTITTSGNLNGITFNDTILPLIQPPVIQNVNEIQLLNDSLVTSTTTNHGLVEPVKEIVYNFTTTSIDVPTTTIDLPTPTPIEVIETPSVIPSVTPTIPATITPNISTPTTTSSTTTSATFIPDTSLIYYNPFTFSTIPNSAYYSTGIYGGGSYSSSTIGFPTSSTIFNPTCSTGSYWAGTVCLPLVQSYPSKCAPGFSYSNGECYYRSSSSSNFPCKSGSWNGLTCANQKGGSSEQCGTGKYWNGALCLNNPSKSYMPSCASGNYFQSGSASCIKYPTGASNCKAGQYFNGQSCSTFSSNTKCSSGNAWTGTSCVSTGSHECNRGKYWNGVQCSNSSAGNYYSSLCPQSQYWTGSRCQSSNNKSETCNAGYYWHNPSNCCLKQY